MSVPAVVPSAEGLGLHRPGVLDPAALVDVVDEEVAERSAAEPEEAVEALDLVHQVAHVPLVALREAESDRRLHAIGAHHRDLAHLPVADALEEFAARIAVPAHQAHPDLQVLGLGLLVELEQRAARRLRRRRPVSP